MSILVYIGFSENVFKKNLLTATVLCANLPSIPSFPSLVTLDIVLSVPAYYRDK